MKHKINPTKLIFFAYCLVLIWVVLFKASFSWSEIRLLIREREINLIPFYGLGELVLLTREMLLNVIVFIPLGVYAKMLGASGVRAILYGFSVSLCFEVCQFITRLGVLDVTDTLTNTFGTAIGVCAYLLLRRVAGDKQTADRAVNIIAYTAAGGLLLLAAVLFAANR